MLPAVVSPLVVIHAAVSEQHSPYAEPGSVSGRVYLALNPRIIRPLIAERLTIVSSTEARPAEIKEGIKGKDFGAILCIGVLSASVPLQESARVLRAGGHGNRLPDGRRCACGLALRGSIRPGVP